jgi:aspartyl/glutamyl-tRNA(Asn/Gln) amidotransferase C subunit
VFPIKKIASLCKIAVDEQSFGKDLEEIFGWIDQLQSIDVSSVDLYEDVEMILNEAPDHIKEGRPTIQDIQKNAPSFSFDMFQVPKMVE